MPPETGAAHRTDTLKPSTAAARFDGVPGGTQVGPTVMVTSLEGLLTPAAFTARIRTKYVPGAAVAVSVVAATGMLARFDKPGADPACTM
jgi:hypothetical protein